MQVSEIKEENKHEQIYIDKQEDEEDFSISIKQNESRCDISSPKNNNDLYANINRSQRPGFVNDENMGFSRNEQNWFAGNSSGLTGFRTNEIFRPDHSPNPTTRPIDRKKFDE